MLIPNGFVFEERHVGPLEGNSLIHGMALRKKVIAEVTVVRPVCSRANLLPSPDAKTMVIDLRLPEWTSPSHPPNYINPTVGKWVQLEEAKKLAEVRKNAGDTLHNQPLLLSHHTGVLVTLLCVFMLGPLGIYFLWRRSVKITGKS
jgi:hypothetical protein